MANFNPGNGGGGGGSQNLTQVLTVGNDAGALDITNANNITAVNFYGNGSNLTGLPASGAFTSTGDSGAFQGATLAVAPGPYGSFAQGNTVTAAAYGSFAQGRYATSGSLGSFAQGGRNYSGQQPAHAGNYGSFSQGVVSTSASNGSFAQGYRATASSNGSFAQGRGAYATGSAGSFAQGYDVVNTGERGTFAQGREVISTGIIGSFAQGAAVTAYGGYGSFAQGNTVFANGGSGCFAQGNNVVANGGVGCFAQGANCSASALGSWAVGNSALAINQGQIARAQGSRAAVGDQQASSYVLSISTTDASAEVMTSGPGQQLIIPTDIAWAFDCVVCARRFGGTSVTGAVGDVSGFRINGTIKNVGGTVTIVGSLPATVTLGSDATASTWTAVAVADNTHKALSIQVTGVVDTSIAWVGTIQVAEVG